MHNPNSNLEPVPFPNAHLFPQQHQQQRSLQDRLDYNDATIGRNGAVMSNQEKAALRKKFGFCVECRGPPVQLYVIRKSRINPFWVNREARSERGKVLNGKCLLCYPSLDPNRRDRYNNHNNPHYTYNRPKRRPVAEPQERAVIPPAPTPQQPPSSSRWANSQPQGRPSSRRVLQAPETEPAPPTQPTSASNREMTFHTPQAPPTHFASTSQSEIVFVPDPAPWNPIPSGPPEHYYSNDDAPVYHEDPLPNGRQPSKVSLDEPADADLLPILQQADDDDDLQTVITRMDEGVLWQMAEQQHQQQQQQTSQSSSSHHRRPTRGGIDDDDGGDQPASDWRRRSYSSPEEPPVPPVQQHLEEEAVLEAEVHLVQPNESDSYQNSLGHSIQHTRRSSGDPSIQSASLASGSRDIVSSRGSIGDSCSRSIPVEDQEPSASFVPDSPTMTSHSRSTRSSALGSSGRRPTSPSPLIDRPTQKIIDGLSGLVQDLQRAGTETEFLAEVILSGMREHKDKPPVLLYCLGAIGDMCTDAEKAGAVMRAGGSADILQVLQQFPNQADLVECGCTAVWSLGRNEATRIDLVRANACDVLLGALQSHLSVASLVRAVFGALRALSPDAEARQRLVALRVSTHVAAAMKKYLESSPPIQTDGSAIISNCAVDIQKQQVSVLSLDELDAIVQAMRTHSQDADVMTSACFTLKNLVFEERNCRTLRQCDGVDEILQHATSFHSAPAVPNYAHEIVESMAMKRAFDQSLEEQGVRDLVGMASPKDAIQYIQGYDWSPLVVSKTLQLLQRLVTNSPSKHEHVVEMSTLRDILEAMSKNPSSSAVAEESLTLFFLLLKNPSCNEQAQSNLIKVNVMEKLFAALERHLDRTSLVESALEVLEPISDVFECWSVDGKARAQLVREAIARHSKVSEKVLLNGTRILSNLDFFQLA